MTSLRIRMLKLLIPTAAAAALGLSPSLASAQVRPGGVPQPGEQSPETKPEGVAEQAPKVPGALPTTPVLPPPKGKRKKYQLFELDGYFRLRGDWFKNFHMGFDPTLPVNAPENAAELGGVPFGTALGCGSAASIQSKACKDSIRSSNIRLRLEPVINVDEKASVHFQVDAYDNYVLGSTPDGFFGDGTAPPGNVPIGAFSQGQVAPQAGRNNNTDSIVVKRAWAEVMTPLGLLTFGRQPSHWGMGILANAGGSDPFTGEYDLDSDYGDTVDRLQFGTTIPGTDLRFSIATDWPSTAPTAAQTDLFNNRYEGQPFDLDDNDDVYQWTFVIANLDSPEDFQDLRDQGEVAFNWGTYLVYRKQDFAIDTATTGLGEAPADLENTYAERGMRAYIPDVWAKVGYKKFLLETELVAVIGSIDKLADITGDDTQDESYKIRQYGGVARAGYTLLDDALHIGFESGFATGDQHDNNPQGSLDVRNARSIADRGNDLSFNEFRFDFDYEIDLILFRELIGTVTNAIYFKPTVQYDLTDRIVFRGQAVVSLAHKKAATPGDGKLYGIEFDGDVGYENNGFFAGLSYGILLPGSALDHPADLGYLGDNIGSAGTAQTLQTRLVLKF